MRSLASRLSRLETAARRTRSELVSDEEVINALKSWDWDSRHLDAMFRVIEPGLLGHALIGSSRLRPALMAGADEFDTPIQDFHQMCFLVALGSDILHPVRRELESAKRRLAKPLRNDENERIGHTGIGLLLDAQQGLVRRLFQKHGLQQLQAIVSDLADGSEHQQDKLLRRFVPRVDQTRWNRMVEIVQPFEPHWPPVGLAACSSDGKELWIRDWDGQVRTHGL